MALLNIEHLAFHVAGQTVLADVEMTLGEGASMRCAPAVVIGRTQDWR